MSSTMLYQWDVFGRSVEKNITYLLTCIDLRRSLSNESGVVFQCTGCSRSSAMLNPWDVDDRLCKDHPLEPQTSSTPFDVLHLCK